ncbi:MAG: FAD-dependent oxidoreductase, partial [Flavobacteriaceae bacterium]
MNNSFDLAVIGGGVLGTFHAFHAIKSGLKVALFEKDSGPRGASVRNFGQVVPSGMNSKWQAYGRESLRTYKEIQATFDISVREEGSVYLASNRDEVALLEELHQINMSNGYPSILMSSASCLQKYPGLRADYVKAGLFFPQEIMIEPRVMIHKLHAYLEELGLHLYTDTQILECDSMTSGVTLQSANGNAFSAQKVIICNGSEFKTLYPSLFKESDLEVSKLQMMQTKPQGNFKLQSSILTGLSIRRYEAFAECPS